jgi:radical SAM protein with 4Fe4S-binding SPASM domain
MNLKQKIEYYQKNYDVIDVIDLDKWNTLKSFQQDPWLLKTLQDLHRTEYQIQQRIVLVMNNTDINDRLLISLIRLLNQVDITLCFVVLLTACNDVETIKQYISNNSKDSNSMIVEHFSLGYQYNSTEPVKVNLKDLTAKQEHLLSESQTFCMYPWIHLHAYPTGSAYPCCHAEMAYPVGNVRTNTLKEVWNDSAMKQLRIDMLTETPNSACTRCYEQENSGFFSGRRSANKHHGHHINRVAETQDDGTVEQFEMTYWDIRFSNLCNLKCRSCGHIFSSQWYQDQAKLAGGVWKERNTVLNYAGRTETDMWNQLVPHLDYVEQIYFAGGEPLLMEEHYRILDELVRRKRFDVRLIYNTNFTHTDLKGQSVFEYWKQFDSVAVGASLDASGARGEYIRKGTDWAVVEQNRREMIEICPGVDFYISPTLSIMNALHLPDFHRDWVEKGLIRAQDLNVNILQDPPHYRIDIAPAEYKAQLESVYRTHLEWLSVQDPLHRATVGFESAITYMNATDNTHLLDTFWRKTHELDSIRNEHILDIIPELKALK